MRTSIGMACAVALLAAGCSAHVTETGPQITARPDGVSISIPVQVTVEGLPAGDQVRVWARTYDRQGQQWESSGEFVTDGVGQVDLSAAASTGGTYTGVDPHGLFWSMRLPDSAQAPYPLMDADDVVVLLGVDLAGVTVARTTLRRVVREPAGQVLPIAEAGLVGDLYLPPGTGIWPGVLLLGGAEGGRPDPAYAALLASEGYVVFGLAYFGAPGLPRTLSRIPLEYGLTAARWLAERPEVAGNRVGVVGTAKGAEYALVLASTEPSRFAAVAAHVPSDLVWPGLGAAGTQVSSWTRAGADVPFLRSSPARGASSAQPGQPVRSVDAYARAVSTASRWRLAVARIPVEQIDAPVLLTSGEADGLWPSTPQAQRALDAIAKAGNTHGSTQLDFPGAGHLIGGVPDLPTTRTAIPYGPVTIEAGGDPATTAAAVRDTFSATVELLRKAMPRGRG
ncbi:acyl-CoA thioesterase/BAAT N-terminal domain-containing protein [Pseudonocardia sp. DSM 110487]|uniref:acyl-CoA thioesterase/bile acid-CoA:amino acid N-acyltransferase family protein n=1 Tax=Pseudonocardia sp. DSM 110487 TaxID=2865833 RepID=UPI001C697221|nr:acyl-CoA thioesterase/bile acid-CoA:amino acid N-acyltransferase family protein [Pseudonocardia sp. DSM 110487]QYN36280.1 acyl-CoA thioesterase/BAAT N-terminal domain-containing protein [Pseudonocardia sp. DSM 110487]